MIQHFHPAATFIPLIRSEMVAGGFTSVFEAGCGETFPNAAVYEEHDVPHFGCDIRYDPFSALELANRVLPVEVHRCWLVRATATLIVVCRPDHSGWVRNIAAYMHQQSVLLYVGLRRNVEIDLPGVTCEWVGGLGVGEDGEVMWRVRSQPVWQDGMSYEALSDAIPDEALLALNTQPS